jgi:hypothetical protein
LPALVERSDGVSDCLNFKLSFFLTLLTNYKHGECLSYVGTEGNIGSKIGSNRLSNACWLTLS